MNNIGIYISSFDGCSDIWPSFFKIWNKYWGDCPYQLYLTSNYKDYFYKNLKMLKVGKEISWIERTISTLEILDEEYIIFFLEDYFISKKVNINEIETIVNHMKSENIYYYQLSNRLELKQNLKYIKIDKSTPYPISLQLAVWNRKILLDLLNRMKLNSCSSPWDFERYLINIYKGKTGLLNGVEYDTRDLLGYKNGVLQGKWIRETLKFYKKDGIIIDCGAREIMSLSSTYYYNLKKFISAKSSGKSKIFIKKILKKFGVKFMTD